MNTLIFEKPIDGKVVIYDNDIIKFDKSEKALNYYSPERLKLVAPFKTDIIITEKCNQACINCFVCCNSAGSGPEMSYNSLYDIVGQKKADRIRIVLTGGEPFLHTEIDKILKLPQYFSGLAFVICTNGTNMKGHQFELLKKYNWLTILSIHGGEACHNKYTDSSHFRTAGDNLIRLHTLDARFKIYSVINEFSTVEDIDRLISLKDQYGASEIKFMTPRKHGRFNIKYNESAEKYVQSLLDEGISLQQTGSGTELICVDGIPACTS